MREYKVFGGGYCNDLEYVQSTKYFKGQEFIKFIDDSIGFRIIKLIKHGDTKTIKKSTQINRRR